MCGISGAIYFKLFNNYNPSKPNLALYVHTMLQALQHRGLEGAGIIGFRNSVWKEPIVDKGYGLVKECISDSMLERYYDCNVVIGHVRYRTSGASNINNVQPFVEKVLDKTISLAHNGNITNVEELKQILILSGIDIEPRSDSEIILKLIIRHYVASNCINLITSIKFVSSLLEGSFSLIIGYGENMYLVRDKYGNRPLYYTKLYDGTYLSASETSAFNFTNDKEYCEEVPVNSVVVLRPSSVNIIKLPTKANRKHCVFENIYFARPDSTTDIGSIYKYRYELGKELSNQCPVKADIVVGVPNSGLPGGLGFSNASGIPYHQVLIKNKYSERTFIESTKDKRNTAIQSKYIVINEIVKGKRIVVVDDSIVRGSTAKHLVTLLYEAGAKEVHLRIMSPPVKYPCYYGMNFSTKEELIYNSGSKEDVVSNIGACSIEHIALSSIVAVVNKYKQNYCTACFNGEYLE
jgi:amidophosphoribosyltransferase